MSEQKWKSNKKAEDAWQVLRIQGEFVKGFDELSELIPSISIFGSARTEKTDKYYLETVKLKESIAEEYKKAYIRQRNLKWGGIAVGALGVIFAVVK